MPRSAEWSAQRGKVPSEIAGWVMAVSAWILAWLGVVCLLLSLGLETSAHPQREVAWNRSRELVSFSSYRILPSTSAKFIRSRAGPRESFFTPGLFLSADEVGPVGPPWLDYHGPPVGVGGPGQAIRLLVTPAAPSKGVERAFSPKFLPGNGPNQKLGVL